jgi:hypothetical protein
MKFFLLLILALPTFSHALTVDCYGMGLATPNSKSQHYFRVKVFTDKSKTQVTIYDGGPGQVDSYKKIKTYKNSFNVMVGQSNRIPIMLMISPRPNKKITGSFDIEFVSLHQGFGTFELKDSDFTITNWRDEPNLTCYTKTNIVEWY